MRADRVACAVTLCAAAVQALSSLSASKQPLRDAWASWNPQRAAALDLQQQLEQGTLTLEVSTHTHTHIQAG